MKCWFFLDVVVRKASSVFELLSGENQSLLVWGDSFFVLDFAFDGFNVVWWFNIEGDCLSCKSFDEDLHVLMIINYSARMYLTSPKSDTFWVKNFFIRNDHTLFLSFFFSWYTSSHIYFSLLPSLFFQIFTFFLFFFSTPDIFKISIHEYIFFPFFAK